MFIWEVLTVEHPSTLSPINLDHIPKPSMYVPSRDVFWVESQEVLHPRNVAFHRGGDVETLEPLARALHVGS